jgi:hypothetical protein
MSWNYRIVKVTHRRPNGKRSHGYELREVFYRKNGKPWAHTVQAEYPYGNTVPELRHNLAMMLKDSYAPVFKISEVKKKK